MSGVWIRPAAALALTSATLIGVLSSSGCRLWAENFSAQTNRPPATPKMSPRATTASSTPRTEADKIWERSVRAARTVPLKARVVISRWEDKAGARAERTVLDVVTSDGGRYRQIYNEPKRARGRVVVSDGTTLWQYEPSRRTVLQRLAPPPPPDLLDDTGTSPRERILEGATATVAGRPTQVIALRLQGSPTVRERLWVDVATGRSLKTETFAPSGRLVRRVEMMTVALPAQIDASAFRPDFPPSARTLTATAVPPSDAEAEARRLNLPLKANGYRIRNALHPAVAGTGSAASRSTTHLLYSDGAHAVSVFVDEDVAALGRTLTPKAKPGWQPVALEDGRTAFVQEEKSNARHTAPAAVVWTGMSHRYTAMAHLPLTELLPAARALAAATSAAPLPLETASQ